MLALSCTYEMTPHALSCMERDVTLLTLILCRDERLIRTWISGCWITMNLASTTNARSSRAVTAAQN